MIDLNASRARLERLFLLIRQLDARRRALALKVAHGETDERAPDDSLALRSPAASSLDQRS